MCACVIIINLSYVFEKMLLEQLIWFWLAVMRYIWDYASARGKSNTLIGMHVS